ncbi:MAG: alpha/beta fold hydrolase [Xanthomonadales bacterium]|nr:alpha/beta fold hydrolase [Xanthomonadales bacterium]
MTQNDLPFPAEAGEFLINGPAGTLEVAVDLPDAEHARAGVAVICHPHPLHGGSMHNKVVTMLERSVRESGLATVRFNFRGVGKSEGEHDQGRGETLDLLAVAEWVTRTCPNDALWLAGFSFGAYVALLGARHLPVKQMVSIAPPAGRWDFSAVLAPHCPWLVVIGEEDDVVEPQQVYDWIDAIAEAERPQLIRMPETGHFFHRRLMDLRGAIKNGVKPNLPPLRKT